MRGKDRNANGQETPKNIRMAALVLIKYEMEGANFGQDLLNDRRRSKEDATTSRR